MHVFCIVTCDPITYFIMGRPCVCDVLITIFCVSQVEESVAEEKVHSEERIPHYLTWNGK